MVKAHFVYGLYDRADPLRTVLYVGSTLVDNWRGRLADHRAGRCRTTAKMARRNRVPLRRLAMLLLKQWITGRSCEGQVTKHYQKIGEARWNAPHAWTSEENSKGVANRPHDASVRGGLNQPREAKVRGGQNQPREAKVRGGLNMPREARARGAQKGGLIGGQNQPLEAKVRGAHVRWHVNRNTTNPRCKFCAEVFHG